MSIHSLMIRSAIFFGAVAACAAETKIDFNRDVRPILSENCFACHGPDAGKRKAKLRLDTRDGALAESESGTRPIVPGKPEKSDVIARISTKNPDEAMPPAKEHKTVTSAQLETLKTWIAQGAVYDKHWAFKTIETPAIPAVKNVAWPRNDIDTFILARLEKEGLKPSQEEDKARLLRRLTLDLTGLPPILEDVDAFLADASPNAYEKVVDRLMASPHFGERMTVPWLDLARYADTAGYHNDSLRDMWMWRDWVVKAFNENKPFDQFTIEQIAGDLIPNAKVEQKVATGFHRNVMTSDEGGLIDAEYLNLYIVDRVATTGITWMGMTVGCAQCHDHKYDPVTTKDFYRMYAFFHNVPENGKDGVRDRNPKPFLSVATDEQKARETKIAADVVTAEKALSEISKTLDPKQKEWEQKIASGVKPEEPRGPVTKFPLDADGNGVSDSGGKFAGTAKGEVKFDAGGVNKAFHVQKKGWFEFANTFDFEKNQAFSVTAQLTCTKEGGSPFGKMEAAGSIRGWDVEFHALKPSFHLIHTWPGNVIHVQAEKDLPENVPLHFAVVYDGSGKGAGVKMFVNGAEIKSTVVVDKLTDTIKTPEAFSIGRRGKAGPLFGGTVGDLRVYSRALSNADIATLGGSAQLALVSIPAEKRTAPQKDQIKKFYRENFAPEYVATQAKVDALKKEKSAIEKEIPNVMVMEEMGKPRDTFVKIRGGYDKNGEKVEAGVPEFLPPIAAPLNGKKHTRLDFANWLVAPDQPLTARVAANRLWAIIFGTGLVKTLNDFGMQGEWPSHPELLEWLAADFKRDWNMKRSIKQMLMSASYRQSARVTPEMLEKDSANRLLAHGPRIRLDAEFVRDNALAVSGLLNTKMGGKGVLPFQPPGIWEINEMGGQGYKKTMGSEQYRRGMYVYWRRSTPYPSFLTFDAPNREFCSAVRPRTSTPLQSLVLMNDPVFVEAARSFALLALKEGGADVRTRITWMWKRTLSRAPSAQEISLLETEFQKERENFVKEKKSAEAFLKVGDTIVPKESDAAEVAAWTAVASVLLNLNETITK
ncbi:MAG: DUF1553 domain-containing protein [Planctomycetota bacterium]